MFHVKPFGAIRVATHGVQYYCLTQFLPADASFPLPSRGFRCALCAVARLMAGEA
jgi:hypothetical protein